MGTALCDVLKEGEERETLCAVYKLSTMVRTNLYCLSGDLPARPSLLPGRMVSSVYCGG